MSFQGFNIAHSNGTPSKQVVGFAGVRIFLNGLTPVMIQDARGLGISGAMITATNTTSGNPFIAQSDANGNVLMQLDNNTEILVTKEGLSKTVVYDNSGQFIITLQSNLLFA